MLVDRMQHGGADMRVAKIAGLVLVASVLALPNTANGQDTRRIPLQPRAGVLIPVTRLAGADGVTTARFTAAPALGVAYDRPFADAWGLRVALDVMAGTVADVRYTQQECDRFQGASCRDRGLRSVVGYIHGGPGYRRDWFRAHLGGGVRLYSPMFGEKTCTLIDRLCNATTDYPETWVSPLAQFALGAHLPIWGRHLVLELADYLSGDAGRLQHEIGVTLGVRW
jgi:hypothetical protein